MNNKQVNIEFIIPKSSDLGIEYSIKLIPILLFDNVDDTIDVVIELVHNHLSTAEVVIWSAWNLYGVFRTHEYDCVNQLIVKLCDTYDVGEMYFNPITLLHTKCITIKRGEE